MDKVLDPLGDTVQGLVRGKRGAGRLEVTALWPQISKALDAGVPVKTIWEALSQNGLVSIKRRGFAKEVQARREGPGSSALAAKPAAKAEASQPLVSEPGSRQLEPQPSAGSAGASQAAKSDAPAQAAAAGAKPPEIKPGIPHRPWRTGPYRPPDPNAVFKPRDPLADD